MSKAVYKFQVWLNYGDLEGLFVATKAQVDKLIGSGLKVYFGEVLGKYSEICGPIEPRDIKLISEKEEVVKMVEQHNLATGHNPFNYTAHNPEAFVTKEDFVGGPYEKWDIHDLEVRVIIDKMLEKENDAQGAP